MLMAVMKAMLTITITTAIATIIIIIIIRIITIVMTTIILSFIVLTTTMMITIADKHRLPITSALVHDSDGSCARLRYGEGGDTSISIKERRYEDTAYPELAKLSVLYIIWVVPRLLLV